MQRLKRNQEDDGVSKRAAMDAGVSSLAFDSLAYVAMSPKSGPTFIKTVRERCVP